MRDGVGVVLEGGGDEVAGDDGSGERGDERVLAFVEGVGAQRGEAVLRGELVAGVDDEGFDGSGGEGAGADGVPVVVGVLADVDGEGNSNNGRNCKGANRFSLTSAFMLLPTDQWTIKAEYRFDWATRATFGTPGGTFRKSNDVISLQSVYQF